MNYIKCSLIGAILGLVVTPAIADDSTHEFMVVTEPGTDCRAIMNRVHDNFRHGSFGGSACDTERVLSIDIETDTETAAHVAAAVQEWTGHTVYEVPLATGTPGVSQPTAWPNVLPTAAKRP